MCFLSPLLALLPAWVKECSTDPLTQRSVVPAAAAPSAAALRVVCVVKTHSRVIFFARFLAKARLCVATKAAGRLKLLDSFRLVVVPSGVGGNVSHQQLRSILGSSERLRRMRPRCLLFCRLGKKKKEKKGMEAGRSNPLMVIQMENIPRGLQSVSLIGINYITGVSGPVSWQL